MKGWGGVGGRILWEKKFTKYRYHWIVENCTNIAKPNDVEPRIRKTINVVHRCCSCRRRFYYFYRRCRQWKMQNLSHFIVLSLCTNIINKEWDVLRSSHKNFNAEIIQFINFLIQFADVIIYLASDNFKIHVPSI